MLEEALGQVVFLTRSLTRDPAKSVTELTNLQDIDGGILGLKRCCVDDEVSILCFAPISQRFLKIGRSLAQFTNSSGDAPYSLQCHLFSPFVY